MALLSPRNDVVFKLLFADPANAQLLISLLAAVLRPPSPIRRVKVKNPELPKELVRERGVQLDLLVELEDGTLVNVELQCDPRGAESARWVYLWSRIFARRLHRGDNWGALKPVISIVFLDQPRPSARFHSVFELREVHDHTRLTDMLAIHLIELPRVDQAHAEGEQTEIERWARFLRARSESELESLAQEAPIMAAAKNALEHLSRKPSARRIAQMRREGAFLYRMDLGQARVDGRQEGVAEGRAEGRAEGLRIALRALCEALGIPIDEERERALQVADEETLQAWHKGIATSRTWPGS